MFALLADWLLRIRSLRSPNVTVSRALRTYASGTLGAHNTQLQAATISTGKIDVPEFNTVPVVFVRKYELEHDERGSTRWYRCECY